MSHPTQNDFTYMIPSVIGQDQSQTMIETGSVGLYLQKIHSERTDITGEVSDFFYGSTFLHIYNDVILSAMTSQITGVSIVCSTFLFRHRSMKTSKLRAIGLCEGNPPDYCGFPSQGLVTRMMNCVYSCQQNIVPVYVSSLNITRHRNSDH